MSSIIRDADTFHGISVFGRGVFTINRLYDDDGFWTYAGQIRDGYACGLGVLTNFFGGTKTYAEHGPDGKCDGRNLARWAHGDTDYRLYERGEETEYAVVDADGTCYYNDEACAPDDPRLLALVAQVAPVEALAAAVATEAEEAVANLPLRLAGLELLVTVLLARNRQPPPTVAADVPHAELAAGLVTLPSGLLAMVCEAIVKLKASDVLP